MKTQAKTTIILITIFILGILIGIVADRTYVKHQMKKRFTQMRNPQMLKFVLERIIEPNPEQKEKIDEILKKYDDKFADARFSIMKETRTLMDSLRKELEPILTEEQKERLKEHSERFMMRDWRRPPFRTPFDRERPPDIDFRKRRPFE